MTIRVYDISKKLGLELKVVLATAKKLGGSCVKIIFAFRPKLRARTEKLRPAWRRQTLMTPTFRY